MHSKHALKEIMLFVVLIASAVVAYFIANTTGGLHSGSSTVFSSVQDYSWFKTFIISFVTSIVIIGFLFFLILKAFFNNNTRNFSSILDWKQVKAEQRKMNTDFLIPRNEKKEFKKKEHLVLSQNIKLRQERFFQHALVVSASGTGKSASILMPQLQALDGDVSAVVTDPKSELYRKTQEDLRAKGFEPILLKLDDPNQSIRYNLLRNCRDVNDVRKLAEAILGNDEWGLLSQTLLSAFLFRQYFLGGTVSDVVTDLAEAPQDVYELELMYFKGEDIHKAAVMSFNQFKQVSAGGNTVASIFATIQSKMKVFEFDNIIEISQGESFKIDVLREKKTVLFVSYPEEESQVYSAFLSSFYYQIFNILKGHESVDESKGEMTGLPIYFLLDEFANIGKIPSVDNLISTIRSKKMGMEIFLQNIEQLRAVYGPDVAKTIISNCSTKMTMYGNTEESGKFFSEMAGKKEFENLSISYTGKGQVNFTSSQQEKQVKSSDEIRRFKETDILIVTSNLKPVIDDKNYYYMNKIDFWVHKNLPFSKETKGKIAKFLNTILGKRKKS